MHSTEIRKSFEEFFRAHGHVHLPSFPLIPKDDPTLLLINAGMAPLKLYFQGKATPRHTRLTTIQKCFRAVDIDEVGHTPRHNTFFEMLGNFSFGDYFKEEVIPWAWDYLTNWVHLPVEKLAVSVHEKDEEAFNIWHKKVGLPESKIFRLGDKDNFWMMGDTGPCGPDSEIFYDLGAEFGCGCGTCNPGSDCERWPEIWNLVFTQFNRQADGTLDPLPKKNVDTGMGMERLCMVLQGKRSVFETDPFAELLEYAKSIANPDIIRDKRYITGGVNSLYVVCDHTRAAAFLLADGVYPSNEGPGYVLRRVIRRCLIHLRKLEVEGPALAGGLAPIVSKYGEIYSNISDKAGFIAELLTIEEENFAKLIERNYEELNRVIENTESQLSGEEAFYFYDTLGVPIDLIRDIADSHSKGIDEAGFQQHLTEQKTRARKATAAHKEEASADVIKLPGDIGGTKTTYYENSESTSEVLHVDTDAGIIILDQTPFYPEGGGQVGDTGTISADGVEVKITETRILPNRVILHQVADDEKDKLSKLENAKVTVHVDEMRRMGIRRAHTGTHLLHAALREALGTHVTQSGSKVEDDEFRFDFTHFKAMSQGEIDKVANRVNEWSLGGFPVHFINTTIKEAREMGAMALFEGKYDDSVRMIEIGHGDNVISRELCGGLHLDNSAQLGAFVITQETAIASGVRRITALCGKKAYGWFKDQRDLVRETCSLLKCDPSQLINAVNKHLAEEVELKREVKQWKKKMVVATPDSIIESAQLIGDIKVITHSLENDSVDTMRELGDALRNKSISKTAIFISNTSGDTVNVLVMLTQDLVKDGYKSGDLMKTVTSILGGKGGGRPDMAQGAGNTPEKIPEAVQAFISAFEKGSHIG